MWRNEVIPHPGDAGDDTWGNKPFNERWETGVWGPITYDPESNIAYWLSQLEKLGLVEARPSQIDHDLDFTGSFAFQK